MSDNRLWSHCSASRHADPDTDVLKDPARVTPGRVASMAQWGSTSTPLPGVTSRIASGPRADRAGNLPPLGLPGERRREMQDDAADRLRDPHRDLEQPLAQRGGLRGRARRAGTVEPERLHEDVGRRGEQEPDLIAKKGNRRGACLAHPAGAPRRQGEYGAARLWLVLDRRRRMGEGRAVGVVGRLGGQFQTLKV
jgi:hypothetical protein